MTITAYKQITSVVIIKLFEVESFCRILVLLAFSIKVDQVFGVFLAIHILAVDCQSELNSSHITAEIGNVSIQELLPALCLGLPNAAVHIGNKMDSLAISECESI